MFDAAAQPIHTLNLITTRLYFCNGILYNLPNKKIEKLQKIRNHAARPPLWNNLDLDIRLWPFDSLKNAPLSECTL